LYNKTWSSRKQRKQYIDKSAGKEVVGHGAAENHTLLHQQNKEWYDIKQQDAIHCFSRTRSRRTWSGTIPYTV
jgi:hypothetical protein